MTRSDAIEKYRGVYVGSAWDTAAKAIDALAALGVLKLDEPKTIYGKIGDAMASVTDQSPPATVRLAFEAAGLLIVEK